MKKPFNRRDFIKVTSIAAMGSSGFLQGLSFPEIKRDLSDPLPLFSFSTRGYSVYHLKPATVTGNLRAIVSAAFDGTILCHTPSGELLWKNQTGKDFPFDLAIADINNDGLDEIFVATAGGTLLAFKPDGTNLWTYISKAPLYQVCPIKTSSGEWRILTGGIEEKVFAVSSSGSLISSYNALDVVRHIRKGDILGNGNEYAAVATTSSGLSGNLSLVLLDPSNMQQLWRITNLGVTAISSHRRFFSMVVTDFNNDGKQEIVLSRSWGDNGLIYGFDHTGLKILETISTSVPKIPYRMNLLTHVKLKDSDEEYIFGLFANMLIIYNGNGTFNSILTSKYDFSNAAFDPQSNTYYLGSSPSGGDGIYALNLNHAGWALAFEEIKPVGNLAKIENNIALLKEQISGFERPIYQRSPGDIMLLATKPAGMIHQNLHFNPVTNFTENYGDRSELWCKNIDSRYPYNLSAEQILTQVRQKEADMVYFTLFGGHSDEMYMRPSTMAAILLEAPVYFQGFVFTEMEKVDANMQRIVMEILLPLAEQCLQAGKKIFFQNKNIFWNGSCYQPFWRDLLLDPTFRDVFVPGLEETNCRSQELSLAGRIGLWKTGSFDQWSDRAVTDDACFDRMWEWSSQQVLSHYLRKLVFRASLGADIFSLNIYQGPGTLSSSLTPQIYPFYDMLAKGVVAIPKREELLSVSDLCLGMKSPPSAEYLTSGINSHTYNFSGDPVTEKVFDRLDCYWGGAPLLDHDISKYGYGAERRMLNFLPITPYGMITIVPDDIDIKDFPWINEKISTDGSFFFDENDIQTGALNYKPVMVAKLEDAASRLPVIVKGDAAWSVVRLDREHVRITLIDPGYTDPADREVEIVLQHLDGLEAIDILSRETLTITNQTLKVNIPAGIFRIIDIRHIIISSVDNPVQSQFKVYPNPTSGEITISMDKTPGNFSITISDMSGRVLIAEEVKGIYGSFNKKYLLPQKGLFLVKLAGKGISFSSKVIRV